MGKRIAVKLGGSILNDPIDFKKMAKIAKKEFSSGNEMLLVVSAMKSYTDRLIEMAKLVEAKDSLLDSIAGIGEVLSARLMAAALNSEGVPSIAIDPSSPNWPIFTNDRFGDADPDLPRTCGAVISNIEPLMKKVVPVICGYVGKTPDGRLTTLGRGGSDTTAVTLARCLNMDEVVLVKDSNMMSADPKIVKNVIQLEDLDAQEALMMSLGGAKILHHKALHYLTPTIKMRIVSAEEGTFTRGGTIVHGHIPDLHIEVHRRPLSMITILTNGHKVNTNQLDGVLSISTLGRATIMYLDGDANETTRMLHSMVKKGLAKAVTIKENLAMIRIWGAAIEETPGVIHKIAEPLATIGINILGLQTVHNKIAIFVDWPQREKAAEELKIALG